MLWDQHKQPAYSEEKHPTIIRIGGRTDKAKYQASVLLPGLTGVY